MKRLAIQYICLSAVMLLSLRAPAIALLVKDFTYLQLNYEIAFFIIHGTVVRTSLPCSADGQAVEQRGDSWMEPG